MAAFTRTRKNFVRKLKMDTTKTEICKLTKPKYINACQEYVNVNSQSDSQIILVRKNKLLIQLNN